MLKFGDMLSERRNDKKLLQKDVAKMLNVTSTTISNYENGVHYPDLENIVKLADFFETSIDYLVGRTDYTGNMSDINTPVSTGVTLGSLLNQISQITNKDDLKLLSDFLLFLEMRRKFEMHK